MNLNKAILVGRVRSKPTLMGYTAVMEISTQKKWTDTQGLPQIKEVFHKLVFIGKKKDLVLAHVEVMALIQVEGEIQGDGSIFVHYFEFKNPHKEEYGTATIQTEEAGVAPTTP